MGSSRLAMEASRLHTQYRDKDKYKDMPLVPWKPSRTGVSTGFAALMYLIVGVIHAGFSPGWYIN